ncbi:P-loop NTPase fold protein [Duganella phyllosphaerae]|uniref:KAP NTPase domain-containing protein n=1 Tax=Duganella phyllosphaerae TaxID=762836 RepID=A0A1E7WH72_9BURK|nr:P-loop NTPase fold protein [Duganella phyllosphaerae]OEZ97996.1 hypothetical protein DUPY_32670 [Duganella phyllosphaerae]
MSLAITKANFEELIDDHDNGVIALSGKWGTGKSHMWRQVQKDSTNDAVRKALYVSLFGIKDIMQLKLRIVQSAIPDSKTGRAAREVVTTAVRQVISFAKGFNPAFSALDELAVLAVPAILRNRVIVIDDIERKHNDLNIEEVMGFIDEFTQVYGARILLILNSDKLKDKEVWDKLREKVIDQEITLSTTPKEAFEIALAGKRFLYAAQVMEAVEICKISNIRIMQKIIRTVNKLLDGRDNLSEDVLSRIIPSTVLLSAMHHRGLDEGPTLDFVIGFNSSRFHMEAEMRRPGSIFADVPEPPKEEKNWGALLDELKINNCDDYERVLIDYLGSGLLDSGRVDAVLDRYVAEKNMMEIRERCVRFFELVHWHPLVTDAELLELGAELAEGADLLDAYAATALNERLAEVPGGAAVGEKVITRWLEGFKNKEPAPERPDNHDNKRLNPKIDLAFTEAERRLKPIPSLLDACLRIGGNSNWDSTSSQAMRNATVASFEETIKTSSGASLRDFLRANVALYPQRERHMTDFADALEHFATACRSLCRANSIPRLSLAIRKVFRDSGLESVLEEPCAENLDTSAAPPAASGSVGAR